MTKSSTPIITTLLLIGGSFLILAIPSWMIYVLLSSLVVTLSVHWSIKHRQKINNAWKFITEFCGFCMLVSLFVSTVVMMNQLLGT